MVGLGFGQGVPLLDFGLGDKTELVGRRLVFRRKVKYYMERCETREYET